MFFIRSVYNNEVKEDITENDMNVFDFDKTVYDGDSTYDFVIYCMKKHPKAVLHLPRIGFYSLKYYAFHLGDKTEFKEKMYAFLKCCDTENDVKGFWNTHLSGIKQFYLDMKKSDDLIISASPEFLLKPLEKELGFTVIASRVDPKSGKYTGKNCYHEEKVRRFRELFPDRTIDSFYSDSYSDEPLALLSKRAYIVEGDRLIDWDFNKHKKHLRI